MEQLIGDFLDQLKVGRKKSQENLALYPLPPTYSINLDYLLLDEALRDNLVGVVEVNEGAMPIQIHEIFLAIDLYDGGCAVTVFHSIADLEAFFAQN